MKRLKWLLIVIPLLALLSGNAWANGWPDPPKIWEKQDSYVVMIYDMDGTERLAVVDEFSVDNKLYVTFRLLRVGNDGRYRFDNYPSFYMYDIDGNETIDIRIGEVLYDSAHDGWNDNETVIRSMESGVE